MPKNGPLRFVAGNYLERADGACYVELGDATIYFSHGKVIAMIASGCLYRVKELDSGITFKRVRAALLRQKPKAIQEMKRADLNLLVEAAIMTTAGRLVDEKLGIQTV